MTIRKSIDGECRNKYVGRTFKYQSKYGGLLENILCVDISVCETIEVKNEEVYIESYVIHIISDKGNVYNLDEIVFYDILSDNK
jgi:hypothetical protein